MVDFLKKDYGFSALFIILLCLSIFCSCEKSEPLSIEDRINAVEPAEEKGSAWITIGDKTFLFTKETLFVDSWGGFFSGKQNVEIDDTIVGKYCLAGWGKNDVSGFCCWMYPVGSSHYLQHEAVENEFSFVTYR